MQDFGTLRQPLLGELAMSRKRERGEVEREKMQFTVATYVYACSPRAAHTLRSDQHVSNYATSKIQTANCSQKSKANANPKLKCKIDPKIASISTYFEEKNNKETKKFKSSTGQQDVNTIPHLKLIFKPTNLDLNSEKGQYPPKKSSRGKKPTKRDKII